MKPKGNPHSHTRPHTATNFVANPPSRSRSHSHSHSPTQISNLPAQAGSILSAKADSTLNAQLSTLNSHTVLSTILLVLSLLITNAFAQSPYLGGVADGYASRFTTISAAQGAIAPAWMLVYPSPVQRGELLEVVVFDVADEVRIELFDAQGRMVAYNAKYRVEGEQHIFLETTALAPGVYCLRANRSSDTSSQKIIVWAE